MRLPVIPVYALVKPDYRPRKIVGVAITPAYCIEYIAEFRFSERFYISDAVVDMLRLSLAFCMFIFLFIL
ncbi:hypothetical protein SDC9_106242 [bioreactor metagenome]|uniref:Uncharacterized protein n=1 Tax=bioreactor metagenome TaxID=1076179 RepID=A0A645B1S7_9ZZZZ